MPETVADTGPVLHLHEIGRLPLLKVVSPITIPDLAELLTKSTLRLSRAFRAYLRTLFAAIP